MDNQGKIIQELRFKLDPPAFGLISEEAKNGNLYKENWLTSNKFLDAGAITAILYARQIIKNGIKKVTDKDIKKIWLEIEDICQQWRKDCSIEIVAGQRLLPVTTRAYFGKLFFFQLAKDADLFFYLQNQGDPRTSEALKQRIDNLFDSYGDSILLAITILYEHHIDRIKDLLEHHSALHQIENSKLAPDANRGGKVYDGAQKGHATVHGTKEQKDERWNAYQKYIDELHGKNPQLSYSDLQSNAARHFSTSSKTIQRHTTNPKKGTKS